MGRYSNFFNELAGVWRVVRAVRRKEHCLVVNRGNYAVSKRLRYNLLLEVFFFALKVDEGILKWDLMRMK